jgi:hypothetical protein
MKQVNLQGVRRKDFWEWDIVLLAIGVVECSFNMAKAQGAGRDLIQRVRVQNQREFKLC